MVLSRYNEEDKLEQLGTNEDFPKIAIFNE